MTTRITGQLESELVDFPNYNVELVLPFDLRDLFAIALVSGMSAMGRIPMPEVIRNAYPLADQLIAERTASTTKGEG